MPLSEEELRLLEQMERALVQDDPKLASTLRGTARQRTARRRVLLAAVGLLAGIAVLMAGAILRVTPVGILGFVIMLASATIGLTSWQAGAATGPRPDAAPEPTADGTFLTRLEERLRRRRDDDDR